MGRGHPVPCHDNDAEIWEQESWDHVAHEVLCALGHDRRAAALLGQALLAGIALAIPHWQAGNHPHIGGGQGPRQSADNRIVHVCI